MPIDLMIKLSQALRELPYDIKIASFSGAEGGYTVELVSKDGRYHGSGTSEKTFVAAYTAAERDIEQKLADCDELTETLKRMHQMTAHNYPSKEQLNGGK